MSVEAAALSLAEHVLASPSGLSSAVVEERILLGYGARGSWGHRAGFADGLEEVVAAAEGEMAADAALGAAVRAQAGAGRRALECARREPAEPLARCAAVATDSARDVAARIWPPPLPVEEAAAALARAEAEEAAEAEWQARAARG